MLLLPILLYTVITLVVGDGNYGTYVNGYHDYDDYTSECKKLKHYDIDPTNSAHVNKEAKFSHVEKHGKDYIMISCPIDSQKYALIAEQEGTTSKISISDYSDTVVLADGSHVKGLAKCDGKRIIAKTADGDEVRIKKVACIQYPEAVPWFCSSCNTDSITLTRGRDIEGMVFGDMKSHNPCTRIVMACDKNKESSCQSIEIEVTDINGETEKAQVTGYSISASLTCGNDGSYLADNTDLKAIKEIKCTAIECD